MLHTAADFISSSLSGGLSPKVDSSGTVFTVVSMVAGNGSALGSSVSMVAGNGSALMIGGSGSVSFLLVTDSTVSPI